MRIKGIASVFGSKTISSEEVAEATGSPADFRKTKLGIDAIRVALPDETPGTLGTRAVEALFASYPHLQKSDVEFLILVTQNPDYRLPTTACLVQAQTGLPQTILAYDVNQGCSGFVAALAQAKGLISGKVAKKGLIVTAEVYNRIINRSERNTFGLFGDGATAVFVETSQADDGVGPFFFGTDGTGAPHLILKTGGTALPEKNGGADDYLYMDGRAIFKFVTRTLPPQIRSFLAAQNLTVGDVDMWFFHQANKHMNESLCQALDIPTEKAFFDISDIGNTVSSTIPITLQRAQQRGALKGKRILLCGFGVGLSWGGCLYQLSNGAL